MISKKKYFWGSMLILALMFICIFGMVLYSLIYIDGPGFKTLTLQGTSANNEQKKNEKIILRFVTLGHIKNEYRRNLPPDHKGYPRYGLDKIVTRKLEGREYFDEKFVKAIPKIIKLNPDILFITGDVLPLYTIDIFEKDDEIRDSTNEQVIIEYCWDMITPVLGELTDDFVIAPGNHDIYGAIAEKVFQEKIGELFFSFTKENIRFVVLNSVIKDTSGVYYDKWAWPGVISQVQIDFLKNGFASEWNEEVIFLFVHHSPISIPNWENEIHPLLIGTNCRTVFSGTRFGKFRSEKKDNILYLDGGFEHKPNNNTANNPSYFISTVVYDNYKIKHSLHCVLPTKFSEKFMVLYSTLKSFLSKIYINAKKTF